MSKIKYFTLFFNTIIFFSTKNRSADIDYKDFIKIYRDCTKELYNFFTIDTTKDKRFIKNFDETVKDQLKIQNSNYTKSS